MILKFDLQFFGGGSTSTQQIQKRAPQPEELNTLAQGLFSKIYPSLQSFNSDTFNQAQNTANNAIQQQNKFLSQIPSALSNNQNIVNEMLDVTRSGNIPSGLSNAMNASVNKELQNSMGTMLNGLSGRGVLNSSITGQGISRLGQQAADAFNKNYLSAYQTALSGYGQALQGSQNNTGALLNAINAVGNIPSQAYEGAYAGLMPAFNLWQTWQQLENSKPEMYDTVVTQKQSSCITGDTLITLKNGDNIPVRELKNDDEILAWDFDNGCVTSAPLAAFFKSNDKEYEVLRVMFEDGSNVGVVIEHLFFDLTAGKFVAVNAENLDYIGHEFAKVTKDGDVTSVKVAGIIKDGTVKETYAPQAEGHWNFLANGFISGNDGQLGFVNRFDFDTRSMTYDKMLKNFSLLYYGRCGYILFKDLVSVRFFKKNRLDEFSVALGKGLMTAEYFREYLRKFKSCLFDKCSYEVYTD